MHIPIYQVDAFTDHPFTGNPAAVCPLDDWLDDATLQAIALENNLSETAYFIPENDAYELRWFTPTCEVDLCGHATLASAYVVFRFLRPGAEVVHFRTRQAGELIVRRDAGRLALDFPSRPPQRCAENDALSRALGKAPRELWAARDFMAVYADERDVRSLAPDMRALAALNRMLIVTAPGDDADFVSRFFAPAHGVDEDPVTGSAHCTLIPYWARRLGRNRLRALQVSARGGELFCEDRGERVSIAGSAVLYLEGRIEIPD